MKKANSRSEFNLISGKILNSKRSQSQIITTVLIILLVLAAVVIVWQVVQSTVSRGAGEVNEQTACMGVNIEITNAPAGGPITARRNPGGPDQDGTIVFFVNGARVGDSGADNTGQLDTANLVWAALADGDSVQAGIQFNTGTANVFTCQPGASVTVPHP